MVKFTVFNLADWFCRRRR